MDGLSLNEIYDSIQLTARDKFDIRTVTLGVEILSSSRATIKETNEQVRKRVVALARELKALGEKIGMDISLYNQEIFTKMNRI